MMCSANSLYTIQWVSKITGSSGGGTYPLDYFEGKNLVRTLNKKYPEIKHTLKLI